MKKILLLPFFAVLMLLVETQASSRSASRTPPAATARAFPAARVAPAPPPAAPWLSPRVVTPPVTSDVPVSRPSSSTPVTVDSTIESSVDELAAELGLDAATRDKVAALTRESFLEVRTRIEREPVSRDEVQELLARSSERLHARILELLSPVQQDRYRTLVGLER